jgi:hypothetical protein
VLTRVVPRARERSRHQAGSRHESSCE